MECMWGGGLCGSWPSLSAEVEGRAQRAAVQLSWDLGLVPQVALSTPAVNGHGEEFAGLDKLGDAGRA